MTCQCNITCLTYQMGQRSRDIRRCFDPWSHTHSAFDFTQIIRLHPLNLPKLMLQRESTWTQRSRIFVSQLVNLSSLVQHEINLFACTCFHTIQMKMHITYTQCMWLNRYATVQWQQKQEAKLALTQNQTRGPYPWCLSWLYTDGWSS